MISTRKESETYITWNRKRHSAIPSKQLHRQKQILNWIGLKIFGSMRKIWLWIEIIRRCLISLWKSVVANGVRLLLLPSLLLPSLPEPRRLDQLGWLVWILELERERLWELKKKIIKSPEDFLKRDPQSRWPHFRKSGDKIKHIEVISKEYSLFSSPLVQNIAYLELTIVSVAASWQAQEAQEQVACEEAITNKVTIRKIYCNLYKTRPPCTRVNCFRKKNQKN